MTTRDEIMSTTSGVGFGTLFYAGECTITIGPRGGQTDRIEQWRANGAVKTWITRPEHFSLPIKHGMRDYAYIDQGNMALFHLASDCAPTIIDNRKG